MRYVMRYSRACMVKIDHSCGEEAQPCLNPLGQQLRRDYEHSCSDAFHVGVVAWGVFRAESTTGPRVVRCIVVPRHAEGGLC